MFRQLVRVPLRWASRKTKASHSLRRSPKQDHYLLDLLPHNGEHEVPKQLEQHLSTVTSVTIGEQIDFRRATASLRNYQVSEVIPDEVLNININASTNLMVLSNGTLVGWNLDEDIIINNYASRLKPAVDESYVPETDAIDWLDVKGDGPSYLQGEILVTQNNDLREKAAFAIGFSRSTRLAILENALDRYLERTKMTLNHRSEKSSLELTEKLYRLRAKLNLHSELIETPDLYWEEPQLEKIYSSISRALDINPRISILNRKLDYATDEQRAYLSVLNEQKSTRLEWIIIWLITIEVGFELFHFYERYGTKNESS
ncbi:MIOREX complex component 10 [Diutina catenulata]